MKNKGINPWNFTISLSCSRILLKKEIQADKLTITPKGRKSPKSSGALWRNSRIIEGILFKTSFFYCEAVGILDILQLVMPIFICMVTITPKGRKSPKLTASFTSLSADGKEIIYTLNTSGQTKPPKYILMYWELGYFFYL